MLGPLASSSLKGPKEISDEARTRTLTAPFGPEHFCQAALPVRDMEVWGRTELGKRQHILPPLHLLEPTAQVLVCSREKIQSGLCKPVNI